MQKNESKRSQGAACAARILALLLIICLAECATGSCLSYGHSCWGATKRGHINAISSTGVRGVLENVLFYREVPYNSLSVSKMLQPGLTVIFDQQEAHAINQAHGKRSAKPPTAAPDWYLTRLLRRMAVNAEMNRARQDTANDDINAIFQMDVPNDSQHNRLMNGNDDTAELGPMKAEAIPMLDDELLSKMKLWKIMRDAAEEK